MIILDDLKQGTPEWFTARAGRITASNFDKIVTTKGKPSTSAKKHMLQLAGERIIETKEESYQNAAMQRGIEMEPEARALYEMVSGSKVQEVGLCYLNDERKVSCSPDGLVGDDGGLEIKCPSLPIHVGYLIDNKLPTAYIQQVQGSMYVTGRVWWDFFSYYPGMKPLLVRVERDDQFIMALVAELAKFLKGLDDVHKQLI